MRLFVGGLSLAVMLALAPSAHANGRFPFANQLVVAPKDSSHIALRATYGFLQTFDAGKSWSWLCERSVGYGGTFDPAIGITANGTLLAGVFDGLSLSSDRGCNWSFSGPPLDKEFIIDLVVERDDPMRAVALTSTGLGDPGFRVLLGETTDGGKTWARLGVELPKDLNSETVEVAPSDPKRIYISGSSGVAPRKGVIERSDDRGKTWVRTEVPLGGGRLPFISAVHPTRPDVLYVRVDGGVSTGDAGSSDRLLISEDGAKTFREVARIDGSMLGFALSPDGTRIAIGGPLGGLLTAATSDHAFRQTSSTTVRCLTWTEDALFVCGTEYPDNFTVARTKNEGQTLEPIYNLSNLAELSCPASSETATLCAGAWVSVRDTIGIPDDAGPDVGAGTAGAAKPDEPRDGGCACSLGTVNGRAFAAFGALAALVTALIIRRN
jgi:hypothetical protein